jgi:2,3-dihydroxyphenylpropionate 1,2-dioxygenase
MPTATLVAMSHSPMVGIHDPEPATVSEVERHLAAARHTATTAQADVTVVFAPDHYNGFFYRAMPPFCMGTRARSVGDFGTLSGEVLVDPDALDWVGEVMAAGIDLTVSADLEVDYGVAQPLELLFGGLDRRAVLPVFVNCVAPPFVPMNRIRMLGAALGTAIHRRGLSALFIASGGLSHDPPVPTLESAPPHVAQAITSGERPTQEQRARLESRMVAAAGELAAGRSDRAALNPAWDELIMRTLASGDLAATDSWSASWCAEHGGGSAHEIRTWVAAYAALATFGPYADGAGYYRAIPEWFAGFGIATASTDTDVGGDLEQPAVRGAGS